jgi:2,4-dienoyl-CoA reductase-like NADH-dependent reductase (Old Yellow Enzyme family)
MMHSDDFNSSSNRSAWQANLRDRVIVPMELQVCDDGVPSEVAAQHYAQRAEGGASFIATEGLNRSSFFRR